MKIRFLLTSLLLLCALALLAPSTLAQAPPCAGIRTIATARTPDAAAPAPTRF